MPFRNSRSLTRAATTATGRALRIVMVLSLWHAPIPWVHVHEFQGPQVERLESLARHIAEFHARDFQWGSPLANWHAHLVLPWCLTHHHNCPSNDERNPGSDDILGGLKVVAAGLTAGPTFGQPTNRAFLAGDMLADEAALGQYAAGTPGGQIGLSRFRHFLETYGSSVAVRDLMGVRLC